MQPTWTLPHIVAGVMVLSLNAYVLLGGADFGGGVWDLFARGNQKEEQRALIANAIGPIWEANHVWLILVVVLLFSCFPTAYACLATELHVPITLMLVGIVLRGSAFTFRTYDSKDDAVQLRWGRIFSVASVVTPMVLGVCLGTVMSGRLAFGETARPAFAARYVAPWAGSLFTWCVGALTLTLFAFLAATYLTLEARDEKLRETFRRRALQSQVALVVMALLTFVTAWFEAPLVFHGLTQNSLASRMQGAAVLAVVATVVALRRRRYAIARVAAVAQASFLLWGWAWSQFPLMLPPNATIAALAAPRITLVLTLGALSVGTAILLPSFVYLFRVFKAGESAFEKEKTSEHRAVSR